MPGTRPLPYASLPGGATVAGTKAVRKQTVSEAGDVCSPKSAWLLMDFSVCYEDSVSSVAAAARRGRWRRLRRLVRRGRGVDGRDNRGWNALHEAAAAGAQKCVKEVLSAGRSAGPGVPSYVNSVTHEGESACYLAAQRGHLDVVRLLLDAHADVNQPTNDLSCPLYAAVDGGHRGVVELLVSEGAEVTGTHTASCWTVLHQAVYKDHRDIVRVLVNVCNLEAPDDHKITPLFVAAQYGRRECLEMLIRAGASVNAQAADMATPLLIGSQEGHQACVDLLLDHGADPNVACSHEWPQLPVHAAAEFGHIGILRRLIGVTDRRCDRGDGEVSPLYVAVHADRSASVETLLEDGFSPDAQDCSRRLGVRSPLALALERFPGEAARSCVRFLLAAGASLSEDDWLQVFSCTTTDLLDLVLDHRWISRPAAFGGGRPALKREELRGMICVALSRVHSASCWLPVLLRSGLDPTLLLQPYMLQRADGAVVTYLLQFVNWSTLSPPLRRILDQRRAEKTWEPDPALDSLPHLVHICRLQVRRVLGPDALMRTDVVHQLPVPDLLCDFLRFRDIREPPLPMLNDLQRNPDGHQHRHVL